MKEGKLYKWSYRESLLRSVNSREVDKIINEVHEGMCSTHQGSDMLYRRILQLGYYWPSITAKGRCTPTRFAKCFRRLVTYYKLVSNVIPFTR